MGLAKSIERGEEEFVVGAWVGDDIWFHDLVAFGSGVLGNWHPSVQELRNGNPKTMDNNVSTFILMSWCYSNASAYGLIEDPRLVQEQRDVVNMVTAQTVRERISAEIIASQTQFPELLEQSLREVEELYAARRECYFRMIFFDTTDAFIEHGESETFQEAVETARISAERVHSLLTGGQDWDEAVGAFPPGNVLDRSHRPILIGHRSTEPLAPPLSKALLELEPGSFSEPIRTENGYGIVRLEKRTEAPSPIALNVRKEAEELIRKQIHEWGARKMATDLANLPLQVETFPERIAPAGGDPDDILVRITIKGRDDPAFLYRLGSFQHFYRNTSLNEQSNVVDAPDGKERFLDRVTETGMLVAWGKIRGWSEEPFLQRKIVMKWRSIVADEAMERMSQIAASASPVTEEELRAFYQDNLQRYSIADAVSARLLRVNFRWNDITSRREKALFTRVALKTMSAILEKAQSGTSLEEAVRNVWADEPSPGRFWARNALLFLGPEPNVNRFEVIGPEMVHLDEMALLQLGVSSADNRQKILNLPSGESYGPLAYNRPIPGIEDHHSGYLYLEIVGAIPGQVHPFESVRERVDADYYSFQTSRKRGDLQREYLDKANPFLDYGLFLDGLDMMGM